MSYNDTIQIFNNVLEENFKFLRSSILSDKNLFLEIKPSLITHSKSYANNVKLLCLD